MTDRQPEKGATASIEIVVTHAMAAARLATEPGEAYPEVLSTPSMIGHLERACAKLLEPLLEQGELSVGARIEVAHVAPTAVGARVRCRATFVALEAPLYWFDVRAEDGGGTIGRGRIARAIVNEAAILARAAKGTDIGRRGLSEPTPDA
jgi:predicted thioesterase